MGHENHAGMSPAHRRNQNPVSPSATLFRKSATFSREEPDLSWTALLKRHRFLLLMLLLLTFLCTIYLYFAIKLGTDSCSGLSANEEALCRLKRSKVKSSRGHRALLSIEESTTMEKLNKLKHEKMDAASWVEQLSLNGELCNVLALGCNRKDLAAFIAKGSHVTSDCEKDFSKLASTFDVILYEDHIPEGLSNGEGNFLELEQLVQDRRCLLEIFKSWTEYTDESSPIAILQRLGWTCFTGVGGMTVCQK